MKESHETQTRKPSYIFIVVIRALCFWRSRSSRKDGCTFSKWETWPNTLLAHRLQKFAEAAGKGDQVPGRLYTFGREPISGIVALLLLYRNANLERRYSLGRPCYRVCAAAAPLLPFPSPTPPLHSLSVLSCKRHPGGFKMHIFRICVRNVSGHGGTPTLRYAICADWWFGE